MTGATAGSGDTCLPKAPTVYVLDDDPEIREALSSLLRSVDLAVQCSASVTDFLQAFQPRGPGCLVVYVRLPGRSGLDFQDELSKLGIVLPIILMTGHGDIQMSVRAMKAGAVDFLTKPFRDQDMLDAIAQALARDAARRRDEAALDALRSRYETLTAREREVLTHVTAGLMNKQISGVMSLSEVTVKIHRGHAVRKMGAKSLADLVRMAEALGIARSDACR